MSRAKDEDVSPERVPRVGRGAAPPRRTTADERDEAATAPRAGGLLRRLPGAAGRGRARRLRRPDPPRADAAARAPRAAGAAARALPLRAGRRVPGHEPRAARAGAPAGGGGPGPNITVVGDDDQAIYRWRGAAAANLLAFRRLYPGAREVVLTENHRSTQPILDAAARLISYNNPYRLEAVAGIDKRLRSQRAGDGPPVRHLRFDTVSAEADGVAALIEERLRQGYRPRDVALLVRSNDDADPFLRALNVRGIPHRFSGSRGLYAREEVRLLVAFLRALANPDDSVSVFYLAASELYRLPASGAAAPQPLRRAARPGRCSRCCAACRRTRSWPASAGPRARAPRACWPTWRRPAADVPRLRTGEVLYKFLQSSGLLAGWSREASAEAEAQGQEHRALLRRRERLRRRGRARPRARLRGAPRPAARGGRRPRGGRGRAGRRRRPRPDRAQGQGPRVPASCSWSAARRTGSRCSAAREPLELPAASLAGDAGAGGDAHLHEERRLFYVGMTRAKDELVLTSAADYGTARAAQALAVRGGGPRPARRRRRPRRSRAARGPGAPPAAARRRAAAPVARCGRRRGRCASPSGRSTTTRPAR